MSTKFGGGPFAPGSGSSATSFAATGPLVQAFVICGALITLPSWPSRSPSARPPWPWSHAGRRHPGHPLHRRLLHRRGGPRRPRHERQPRRRAHHRPHRRGRPGQSAVGDARARGPADRRPRDVRRPRRHHGADTHDTDLAVTRGGTSGTAGRRRVEWSCAFITDDSGEATHVVMTGIDRTRERTADELVRHILQAPTTTALIGVDDDGTITVVNAGALEMLGGGDRPRRPLLRADGARRRPRLGGPRLRGARRRPRRRHPQHGARLVVASAQRLADHGLADARSGARTRSTRPSATWSWAATSPSSAAARSC